MAVQSTGIVWASSNINATSNPFDFPAYGHGAPNGQWADREYSSTLNETTAGSCVRYAGYGSQINTLLPTLCVIRGLKLHFVRRPLGAGTAADSLVQLMSNINFGGGILGSNQADGVTPWANETKVYGAEDSLWGASLTRAIVTGTDFGVALGQKWLSGGGAYNLDIDAVGIEVFHEEVLSTGPLFPNVASSTGWANPDNAKADDTSYATRTFAGSEDPGVATAGIYLSDYGADIPPNSEILGCLAQAGRFATTAGPRDRFVQLHNNKTLIGANKWVSGSNWGTSASSTVSYGDANSDHWSVAGGLTPELINSPDFGIVLEARNTNASARQGNIDFGSLEFYYIPPDIIEAEATVILAELTTQSAAQLLIDADVNVTLEALTTVSAASLNISGEVSATLEPLTTVSAGNLIVNAGVSVLFEPLTMEAAATLSTTGGSLITLAALTMSAEASIYDPGGFAIIRLAALTMQSAAALNVAGQSLITLQPLTSVSAGNLIIGAGVSVQLEALTMISAGKIFNEGTVSVLLQPLTSVAEGSLIVAGGVNTLLAPLTLTSTIQFVIQAITPAGRILNGDFGTIAQRTVEF